MNTCEALMNMNELRQCDGSQSDGDLRLKRSKRRVSANVRGHLYREDVIGLSQNPLVLRAALKIFVRNLNDGRFRLTDRYHGGFAVN